MMENLSLLFPLVSVIFSVCALLLFKCSKSPSKTKLPPGSFGWPIIGETFAFINETQQTFVADRMKRHSPKLFKTNVFGEPTVVLCDISGHKFIASNEEKLFLAWRPHSMQRLFRSSYQKAAATIPRAEGVQIYRAPGFLKPEALGMYLETMDLLVQEHLKLHWDGKSSLEVYHIAQLLVMTLTASSFTGIQRDQQRRGEEFAKLMNVITSGLHTFPFRVPGTTFYRAMNAADALRKEILLLIKEKKAEMSSGVQMHDIMSFMLCNTDPTGRFVPENEVADKIMGLMAGGFHSPSLALSFMIKYLGENPDLCDKVRTEQLDIARSKQSSEALIWDDIQKMKFSWCVALEVMRMVPPLEGTFREVITDFTYEGYTIPKGWKVYWSASSTNKVSEYFPAPEEFDPTRFENGKSPPAYSNIPFGSGPRICPGKEYARLQLMCTLHHIVTKYKWELINPKSKIAGGMNPVPEEGIHIRLQPIIYRRAGRWPF